MSKYTYKGIIFSVKVDDGFGNLIIISFDSLIARLVTFERTSNVEIY